MNIQLCIVIQLKLAAAIHCQFSNMF